MLLLTTEPLWGTFKAAVLATAGGGMYCGVELLFRGRTHWTMVLVGGICFLLIGLLNERYPWEMALTSQMLLAAAIVTAAEFLVGMVLNVWMRLDIWNYSDKSNGTGSVKKNLLYPIASKSLGHSLSIIIVR